MSLLSRIPAILALEDGTIFRGSSFGSPNQKGGEIIFHTGMTGYQEILTDPSYRGQIVVMTYPEIGNYGTNQLDSESGQAQVAGFVVKQASRLASNFRSGEDLRAYLTRFNIPAIEGVDTRALVLHLRQQGSLRAVIGVGENLNAQQLVAQAQQLSPMEGQGLVYEVGRKAAEIYQGRPLALGLTPAAVPSEESPLVVAFDFGAKNHILDLLVDQGLRVRVVPARTSAQDVLSLNPQGVFYSNGPGDPAALPDIVATMKELLGRVPAFGICLGHQLLALASGAKTYKLKFGHHGANHPVKDLTTGKVEITSQNHGFCVDADSLPPTARLTHMNLNDQTVEGFEDPTHRFFCVQYHPEAAPGPHDSIYLFERFRNLILNKS
jgi:carbamoyl-phosphate synthase small subunit